MDQVRYDLDPSNWGKLSHSTGRTRMSVKRAAQGGQWKAASSTMMESGYKHNEGKEGNHQQSLRSPGFAGPSRSQFYGCNHRRQAPGSRGNRRY